MNSLLLALQTSGIVLISIFGVLAVLFIVYLCFVPMKSYFTALFSGAYVWTFRLLGAKNRKIDVKSLTKAYILAKKSGLKIKFKQIENVYAMGGNGEEVIKAMLYVKSAGLNLDFDKACAIEFSSHDIKTIAQNAVESTSEVVDNILGVTQDNFEMNASVRVSVKVNLDRYLTSGSMDDLKSCIKNWIMQNIGAQKDHKKIILDSSVLLQNMDKRVLSGISRYNVENVTVEKTQISRDLNAEKSVKMAEKEKVYAQMENDRQKHLEEVKIAQKQAEVEEKKAEVLEAEANISNAIAKAIENGNFSAMDYMKMMNLQADTDMRRAFLNQEDDDEGDE